MRLKRNERRLADLEAENADLEGHFARQAIANLPSEGRFENVIATAMTMRFASALCCRRVVLSIIF